MVSSVRHRPLAVLHGRQLQGNAIGRNAEIKGTPQGNHHRLSDSEPTRLVVTQRYPRKIGKISVKREMPNINTNILALGSKKLSVPPNQTTVAIKNMLIGGAIQFRKIDLVANPWGTSLPLATGTAAGDLFLSPELHPK
jgi:hypothetical protein